MTDTKNASDKRRKTVSISHARPEDDALMRWLCGRLSALGYQAWADLEQLHGGDPFWTDIENTLRFDTIRFLSIVTRVSVTRKGVKDELAEACDVSRKLADPRFLILIKGDDLPWDEFPIQLKQANGLDFSMIGRKAGQPWQLDGVRPNGHCWLRSDNTRMIIPKTWR